MKSGRPSGILEQTISLLREGIRNGRWLGDLPGVCVLAKQLEVSPGTVQSALKRLEKERLLKRRGKGRRREIPIHAVNPTRTGLRVGLLLDETYRSDITSTLHIMDRIQIALEKIEHRPFFATDTMKSLGHTPEHILAMIQETPADLWIVWKAERPVLEALARHTEKPILAIGGSPHDLQLDSFTICTRNAIESSIRSLTRMGHKRIVLVIPPSHNVATSRVRSTFLEALHKAGIVAGPYHVPTFGYDRDGFEKLLKSLFKLTPPTAMIVADARQVVAIHSFLSSRGLSSKELALIVMHPEWPLDWMKPRPGYFKIAYDEYVTRAIQWTDACARGHTDHTHTPIEAKFVPGEFRTKDS